MCREVVLEIIQEARMECLEMEKQLLEEPVKRLPRPFVIRC